MPSESNPLIEPLGPYVVVELLPDAPVSDLLLVPLDHGLTQRARVLAVGPKVPDLTVGDTVLCRPMQGTEIGPNLLLPAGAILATVEP